MRDDLRQWMEAHKFATVNEMRGRLSLANTADPAAFERAQYVRTLSGWSSLMAYQAYQRTHDGDDEQTPPS
jgi:dihydroorotate dehydrogenase (fumarate)